MCLKEIGVFLIVGNGGLMHIYIYLSILKVIGTYELKQRYDHESMSVSEKTVKINLTDTFIL